MTTHQWVEQAAACGRGSVATFWVFERVTAFCPPNTPRSSDVTRCWPSASHGPLHMEVATICTRR